MDCQETKILPREQYNSKRKSLNCQTLLRIKKLRLQKNTYTLKTGRQDGLKQSHHKFSWKAM